MYQNHKVDPLNQEATGLIDNPSYSNLEWLHNQDFKKEDLSSPKPEPIWIQNQQYTSPNPEKEQSSIRGHFGFQDQSHLNQSFSHDPLFRPDLLVHTQDQSVHQANNVILPNVTGMEAENLFTNLNSNSNHHQYWNMTGQLNIDPNHQPHQGVAAPHPKPRPSIPRKVTKQTKTEIVTTKTTRIHPGNANTKIITTMVSRPTQTFKVASMVSKATQTLQPTENDAAGINSLKFRKLYSTLKKLDMKESSHITTPDHALRMAQSKQSILQSLNIQVANLNKIEAASIFALYCRSPFPNVLPESMDSTMT
jgi:hypothetical protein